MGSENRTIQKTTGIFVALEAVFIYYIVGLLASGYRPGFVLYGGWKILQPYEVVPVNPLRNLLGLTYVVKTLFPLYWEIDVQHIGILPPIPLNVTAEFHNQVIGASVFLLVFWLIMLIAGIAVALRYYRKLKAARQSPERTHLPSL